MGLKNWDKFELNINCKKYIVFQRNVVLKTKVTNNELRSFFFYFENDSSVNNYSSNVSNCDYGTCMTLQSFCGKKFSDIIKWNNSFNSEWCFNGLFLRIFNHFSKHKYDVGIIRIELQRILLKSDLPISLRPYRTSPQQKKKVNSQVRTLLESGLVKESNSSYSARVTLVMKNDEGEKTRLCVDYQSNNSEFKSKKCIILCGWCVSVIALFHLMC